MRSVRRLEMLASSAQAMPGVLLVLSVLVTLVAVWMIFMYRSFLLDCPGALLCPKSAARRGDRAGDGYSLQGQPRAAPARPRPARSPMVPAEPALTTADAVRAALAGLSDDSRAEQ